MSFAILQNKNQFHIMQFQFKIQLAHISKPTVWRRVLVPEHFSFEKFHRVIQAAFGWGNYHLYQFSPTGYGSQPQIGIPDDSGWSDEEIINSKKIKLSEIFNTPKQKFTYIYDFGDAWTHKIELEQIKEQVAKKASLLEGKSACPPEDCGGPWGYTNLLKILADPEHEEYEDMREWLGLDDDDEEWQVNYFNFEEAKEDVASV
jgi:hypothetical protein